MSVLLVIGAEVRVIRNDVKVKQSETEELMVDFRENPSHPVHEWSFLGCQHPTPDSKGSALCLETESNMNPPSASPTFYLVAIKSIPEELHHILVRQQRSDWQRDSATCGEDVWVSLLLEFVLTWRKLFVVTESPRPASCLTSCHLQGNQEQLMCNSLTFHGIQLIKHSQLDENISFPCIIYLLLFYLLTVYSVGFNFKYFCH